MSNSAKDIEMYNTYSRIGSDHRALRAKVKTSLRTCKAHNGKPQNDWSALRSDENLQLTYSVTVKNRYAALCEDTQCATEKCKKLIQSNKEATEKLIPKKSRNSAEGSCKKTHV